jgi:hypothetical protein
MMRDRTLPGALSGSGAVVLAEFAGAIAGVEAICGCDVAFAVFAARGVHYNGSIAGGRLLSTLWDTNASTDRCVASANSVSCRRIISGSSMADGPSLSNTSSPLKSANSPKIHISAIS